MPNALLFAQQSSTSSPASSTAWACSSRTLGMARAQAKLTLANLTYNFDQLIFHKRRAATG
jgi:hypothetical protein